MRVEAQFSAASADTCRVFIDFNLSLAPHARIIVLRCIRLLALKLFFRDLFDVCGVFPVWNFSCSMTMINKDLRLWLISRAKSQVSCV